MAWLPFQKSPEKVIYAAPTLLTKTHCQSTPTQKLRTREHCTPTTNDNQKSLTLSNALQLCSFPWLTAAHLKNILFIINFDQNFTLIMFLLFQGFASTTRLSSPNISIKIPSFQWIKNCQRGNSKKVFTTVSSVWFYLWARVKGR